MLAGLLHINCVGLAYSLVPRLYCPVEPGNEASSIHNRAPFLATCMVSFLSLAGRSAARQAARNTAL